MRLVEFDDYPFHQVPTPFSVSGTSDVHFNDGYWFSAYADGWYLATGLRLHPNTNVMDCFASVAREGEQTAVRASRVLRPELTDHGGTGHLGSRVQCCRCSQRRSQAVPPLAGGKPRLVR